MVSDKIRFEHFLTEKGIISLQLEFLKYDEFTNSSKRGIVKPMRKLTIQIRELYYYLDEPSLSSETIVTKEFLKDFLIPSIKTLSDKYYDAILKIAESSGVFTKEQRESFIKKYIHKTRNHRKSIVKADVVDSIILQLIEEQLNILEGALESFVENPYPQINTKLKFNWIRTDVEYFFYLLRENKQIAYIEDADLGRIIDNLCECHPDLKSLNYTKISNSKSKLNNFKNGINSGKKPNKRLRAKFNEDYFNV